MRRAVDHAHVLGALHGGRLQRPVPKQPRQRPDRPVDRLRSADTDRLRPRLADGQGRGRQGRCPDQPPRGHAHAARWNSAGTDEHVDDDQRDGAVAPRPLRGQCRRTGRRPGRVARHDAERHRQGVPVARHVHPASSAVAAAHRRSHRVVCGQRADVEPDQHLLLPPAGGRCDAGTGAGLLARHGDRGARRSARIRSGR